MATEPTTNSTNQIISSVISSTAKSLCTSISSTFTQTIGTLGSMVKGLVGGVAGVIIGSGNLLTSLFTTGTNYIGKAQSLKNVLLGLVSKSNSSSSTTKGVFGTILSSISSAVGSCSKQISTSVSKSINAQIDGVEATYITGQKSTVTSTKKAYTAISTALKAAYALVTTGASTVTNKTSSLLTPPTPKEIDTGNISIIEAIPKTNDDVDYGVLEEMVKNNIDLNPTNMAAAIESIDNMGAPEARETIRQIEGYSHHPVYGYFPTNMPQTQPVSESVGSYVNWLPGYNDLDLEYEYTEANVRYTLYQKLPNNTYIMIAEGNTLVNAQMMINASNEYFDASRELTRNSFDLMPVNYQATDKSLLGDMFWSRYISQPTLQNMFGFMTIASLGDQVPLIDYLYPVSTSEVAPNEIFNIEVDGIPLSVDLKGNIVQTKDLINQDAIKP